MHDQELIEKRKRVCMLKSVLADCRLIKLELKKLSDFIDEGVGDAVAM